MYDLEIDGVYSSVTQAIFYGEFVLTRYEPDFLPVIITEVVAD